MLAKALGVDSIDIWRPLTLFLRAIIRDLVSFCPDCGSKRIVKNGHNHRRCIPRVQIFECKECGRRFCERANTIFYWKHACMGELFMVGWIFYGIGSRRWPGKWISDLGKSSLTDWFERLEGAMERASGTVGAFIDGFFQADEMMVRSLGERLWVSGVRRADGKICLNVLKGDNSLVGPLQETFRFQPEDELQQNLFPPKF